MIPQVQFEQSELGKATDKEVFELSHPAKTGFGV